MGIYINGQELELLYYENISVLFVAINGEVIWPTEVKSCFSNGFWIDDYPWLDDELWND